MSEMSKRIEREQKTVKVMIDLYCQKNHRRENQELKSERCPSCETLYAYARRKIERCPLIPAKPVCAKCKVHCYQPEMRENMRKVMRFSGPKMIVYHPILLLYHLKDARHKVEGKRPKTDEK